MDKKSITNDMAKPVFDLFIDRDILFHINYLKSCNTLFYIIFYRHFSFGISVLPVFLSAGTRKEKLAYNDITSINIYLMYLFIR